MFSTSRKPSPTLVKSETGGLFWLSGVELWRVTDPWASWSPIVGLEAEEKTEIAGVVKIGA